MRIPPLDFVTASARWTRILSSIGMNLFRAPDAMAASYVVVVELAGGVLEESEIGKQTEVACRNCSLTLAYT